MIKLGVIGYGYWGPNLVRNFSQVPDAQVVAVCDQRAARRALVESIYPSITTVHNAYDLINDPAVDAIAIATPVSTHFELALAALRAGKHVLVEKPLTTTVEQAERLVAEADKQQRVLMVDHTFVYTGAVRKIKEFVDRGSLGQLYYYDSVRVNLGLFQHDVNVLWDLAVHDLSIMDFVLGERPVMVAATGVAHIAGQPTNLAYLTCFFEHNLIAHFHVNWLAPVKVRRTLIGGSDKMVIYDDLEPSEKVKLYDKGVTVRLGDRPEDVEQLLVGYRAGDMLAPQLDLTEALHTEALHFVDCIAHNRRPISDGQAGWRIVRILEAASRSMALHGQPVEIAWERA